MASRKPKGIADDIVDGIRNIMSPWLGTPPNEYPALTQGKAVARTAAETLDQVYAGGMIKAGTQGEKALARQAAINAAALGAGVAVGYGVSKAAGAIVNTGVPARVVNKVKGDIVVVHGTGRPIVGKTINPRAGSAYSPTEPAAFVWNTQFGSGKTRGQDWIHNNVQEYSNRSYFNERGLSVPGQRNIVIGKTQMKDAIPELSSKSVIASKQPITITKVIKEDVNASIYKLREDFIQELKTAGVKVRPNAAQRAFSKIEAKKLAKRYRINNENSPT